MSSLTEALRRGLRRQCDEDGVMCIVSRQACREAADKIERMERIIDEIWATFYGSNLHVANWHRNGDLKPMDDFFEQSDWKAEVTE